ncbi:COPII-coated vesicle budding, variant 3 [Mayamaea pseudoterrestris]|nr:COPII-coated vesicle budding, variant 3 [Mayamaea pseudoterrestris]
MNTTESSFTRYRAGNGPIFSASKTPPGPGLEQSCELPFGFLWTPFNPLSDDNDWSVYQCNGTALPPVMCLTCCAYLNIYAELKVDENVWICPLCQGRNVTTPEMLRSPMTQVPGIEYRQTLAESDERDSLTILLVMDQNLPRLDAHAIGTAVQQVLGTSSTNHTTSLQLGVITFGKMLHIYQIGNASQGLVSADVFAKHEQITDAHLSRQNYLVSLDHDHEFDCLWRTLFAAYGVSAPDETQSDESVPVARLSRLEQLKQNKEERIRKELGETTQANRHQSPWTSSPATDKPTKKRGTRNVGEAMQAAIELATADPDKPARTARIFLFTNGCPNYGDGSVVDVDSFTAESASAFQIQNKIDVVNPAKLAQAIDYFSLVGKASSEAGVAVDVFCSGATEVALASYQALVEPSSGYVLPSLVFEADSLIKNLHYLFHETFVPGLHFNMPDTPGSSMLVADEQWIDGCILDIRVPSFFTVTHVVGPGELVEDSKRMLAGERSSFALGASLAAAKKVKISLPIADIVDATLIRIHVGRVDPISTFSVMLQMNEFFQHESHALFQCIARYINRQGNVLVTKTFTRRLATANDVVEFLDGVDEEVVPVLLGKEAVYRANFGRDATNNTLLETFDQATLEALAYDAQQDIDATIQKISVAYRLLGLQQGTARRGYVHIMVRCLLKMFSLK